MGRKYPVAIKRIVAACLDSEWDFEIAHSLSSVYLTCDNGSSRYDVIWRKVQEIDDKSWKETVSFKIQQCILFMENGRSLSHTMDQMEIYIRTQENRTTYQRMETANGARK